MKETFRFKQFTIQQDRCAMKVGTDGVLLGAWAEIGEEGLCSREERILDIGTGTGLIALMMAQRYPTAIVDAIDIDAEACAQARENIAVSPFTPRINIIQGAVQDFFNGNGNGDGNGDGKYDAIVTNPPFFIDALKAPDKQRSMARHADTLSYHDLMQCAVRLLKRDGELSVVIPFDCRNALETEAIIAGLYPSRICAVRTTPTKAPRRYLLAFRRQPSMIKTTELVIGSPDYQDITKEFYL